MSTQLKSTLIYIAGAASLVAAVWWLVYSATHEETMTSLLVRARAAHNGHVPSNVVEVEEV